MSRAIVVVLVVGVVSLSAAALWLMLPHGVVRAGSEPATAAEDAQRRQRAEEFFGGDPDRDVRGGQEMKPRW